MNIKKLLLATAAIALLSAPASARIDGDEGGASAYARFHSDHSTVTDPASAYASDYAVQAPQSVRPVPQRVRPLQPHW